MKKDTYLNFYCAAIGVYYIILSVALWLAAIIISASSRTGIAITDIEGIEYAGIAIVACLTISLPLKRLADKYKDLI